MRHTPLAFLALVPCAAMAASIIAGFVWHMGDEAIGLSPIPTRQTVPIGGPFALTDQDGRPVSDADFRGRFMLVYFGYTDCPDVCPTTLAAIAKALDKLGPEANRVVPVFVTVDPVRDTPKILKSYLAAFGPRFVGLTGSGAAIKKVASEYSVFFEKHPIQGGGYTIDHSSTIYLMGPHGRFVTHYDETEGPGAIARDLRDRL